MAVVDTIVQLFTTVWEIFIWTWWLILIGVLFITKKRWGKYPLEAIIIEKRGDNLLKTNDRIGRFYDAFSELHCYKLQKTKETIPVFNYDWVMHSNPVPNNFLEKIVNFLRPTIGTVWLFRYGSKQYKPININKKNHSNIELKEFKNNKGETVYAYQYGQYDTRWVLGVLDFEVVDWDNINFMIQEQRASIIRRQKKGDWVKTLAIPAMIIAATTVVSIIMLKYSMDYGRELRGGAGQPVVEEGGSKLLGGIQNAVTPGA